MHAVSIILPTYNESVWLPKTIAKLRIAVDKAKIGSYEIIVVNDGSSDDTKEVLAAVRKDEKHLVVINQANKGRFLARKAGIKRAKYDTILFLDSRVFADEDSLLYVTKQMAKNPKLVAWNGHVRMELGWNLFARFWDAVTFMAWRRYRRKPRLVQYGTEDFDYYPKGTTFFLAPKKLLEEQIDAFQAQLQDFHFVSDDTALLRGVAQEVKITIAPGFSCLYHSRDRMRTFVRHTMHRGTVFVDGFLKPGNRYFLPLIVALAATPLALVALLLWPLYALLVFLVFWFAELLGALLLGVNPASALGLWMLTPMFAVVYGAGIWRGVIMMGKGWIGR